jgi:hypothetical protein
LGRVYDALLQGPRPHFGGFSKDMRNRIAQL